MNRSFQFVVVAIVSFFAFVGCGLQTGEASGTFDPGDPVDLPPACTDCPDAAPLASCEDYGELPPPVRSDRPWALTFHLRYLPPDTNSVQVLGTLPGMNWQSGIPAPCQGAECTLEIPHDDDFWPGAYVVTYVRGLPGQDIGGDDWASYGKDVKMLACMDGKAQRWIHCELENEFDAKTRVVSCGLEFYVSASGEILPAGNMEGFDG